MISLEAPESWLDGKVLCRRLLFVLQFVDFFRGRLSEEREAKMATHLQELRIRVKPNPECARDVKRLVNFNPESMICGYEYNKDACQVIIRYNFERNEIN